ncbi:hypothetical protein BGP77_11040 [Saccharospirillum sp. MSK14-1]|uniref:FG-GAP repeat protein n=1 Tax=Saccharospirillum sp. MSK14-1 TaxID=1897632 RepID=UPI000D3D35E8|nr:FG-GAP repeat protein [Saccharospirillum sp. MSK14-1]PTY38707.1 hypothetical protein BGP77_11040 [Saccharospirillum sp. MSK14-1]
MAHPLGYLPFLVRSQKPTLKPLLQLLLPLTLAGLISACGGGPPMAANDIELTFEPIKQLRVEWQGALGANYYRLLENPDGQSGFTLLRDNIPARVSRTEADPIRHSVTLEVPLHQRLNAQYIVQSCNHSGCRDSAAAAVNTHLAEAVGYVKASNPYILNYFGFALSLSADGQWLAVGAPGESSRARGTDNSPDQTDNNDASSNAGAVYLFKHRPTGWQQEAYIKASNTGYSDEFGFALSLNADGSVLAVGARYEGSNATINANPVDQENNDAGKSGAVYLFRNNNGDVRQHTFIKADNPGTNDHFGYALQLNDAGNRLAVGAPGEASPTANTPDDDTAPNAGAVYVFTENPQGLWQHQQRLKASNAETGDRFGAALAWNDVGDVLAIGAPGERSRIKNTPTNNDAENAGAVYIWTEANNEWQQQAYLKADAPQAEAFFGTAISINQRGTVVAIGANGSVRQESGFLGSFKPGDASQAVHVFNRLGDHWAPQPPITAPTDNSAFGTSLQLNAAGTQLVVGDPGESSYRLGIHTPGAELDSRAPHAGSAYWYTRQHGQWRLSSQLKASNPYILSYFGMSVALDASGQRVAIGTPRDPSRAAGVMADPHTIEWFGALSGAVYLY